VTVAEGEAVEEEEKKGGKKKLIIMIVVILLVGLAAAKMTILKPPPLTDAQAKAKSAQTQYKLEVTCASANGVTPPDPPAGVTKIPLPVVPKTPKAAAVLSLDSITINTADPPDAQGQSHFLKVGLSLLFPAGTDITTIKDNNPGAPALNYVILQLQQKKISQLKDVAALQTQYSYKICSDPTLNDGGLITNAFFTDFVSQ
jgi:flagellar basal body-associated protein FliL